MSTKTTILMAVAASLSLVTNARAQSEEAPPPEPGETQIQPAKPPATPPAAVGQGEQLKLCPPFSREGRTNRDHAPGRGAEIGGGLLIGFGLASLAVGAGIAAWGAEQGEMATVGVASAFAAAGGGAFIAGIPIVATGRAKAKRFAAIDHAELTFGPVPAGGTARVNLAF